MSAWVPLGYDSDGDYFDLVEGMPDYLATSFWEWVKLCVTTRDSYGDLEMNFGIIRQAERVLRVPSGVPPNALPTSALHALRANIESYGVEIAFADFLLGQASDGVARALDMILREGGSAWTTGERMGRRGLLRRVPEGAQLAAEHTVRESGHAGERLAEAWRAAFGVSPDPSKAYSLAVKSVEDAVKPLVAPNDATATLGKMIGQIRSDGDWSLPFQRDDSAAPSPEVLVKMLKMLWAGQADRHGGDPDPNLAISQQAAEAAVMLAALLVQAFVSGSAKRGRRAE